MKVLVVSIIKAIIIVAIKREDILHILLTKTRRSNYK